MAQNIQDKKINNEIDQKPKYETKGQDFKIPSSKDVEQRATAARNNNSNREGQQQNRRPQRRGNDRRLRRNVDTEFQDKVIDIARVTTVTKGGRRFSFSAYVVVGDKRGRVGLGHGKANEVPDAIKKATIDAKKHLISVPIIDKRKIPHEQEGKFSASKVLIKPAPRGTGIIAGGSVRAVVELAGYKDIYTKSFGSRTKANTIKATLKALKQLRTVEQIAEARGIPVDKLKKIKE